MAEDLRQSEGWAKFLISQGWEIEELRITNYKLRIFIRKIPLLGSIIKIQRPAIIPPVEEIDKLAKKHHALCVKLEPPQTNGYLAKRNKVGPTPYELLTNHGFVRDSVPSLPTKSTIIDLTRSERELWETLSQDTRRDIRKAKENRVSVASYRPGDRKLEQALENFTHLLSETGRRKGFWTPNINQLKAKTESFGKNAILLLAFGELPSYPITQLHDYPIAGFLVLLHNEVAYYHYTATSVVGRKLNAAYLLMWETIKLLKSTTSRQLSTIKYFDLGSIYDPRYHKATKGWQNFTTFKRKWRGDDIEYPMPLIKHYHPLSRLIF